jgi:hypothetical protein
MRMGRAIWLVGLVAIIAGVLLVAASASASELDEPWDEPAAVEKVSWSLISIDGPGSITVGVSTGYCVGKKMPRLLHPHAVWRAGRVVITLRIFHPALHFDPHEACAGVGLGMNSQIRLKHPISGRALYDGSTSPPTRRAAGSQASR